MASESDARPPAVVGVDGSEGSVAALRWAVRYGAATGTPVRAVLAWHYPTAAGQPPVGHAPEPVNEEVEGEEAVTLREAIGKAVSDTPGAQPTAGLPSPGARADLRACRRLAPRRPAGCRAWRPRRPAGLPRLAPAAELRED